jgi:Flp pilus assembly pilin Flp
MEILEAETEVIFAISEDGAFASFFGQVNIDGGNALGEAVVTVHAQAEIGDYLDNAEREDLAVETKSNDTSRDLQVGNLLDADWDIDIDFDYNPPQWIIDVGEGIANGIKAVGEEIDATWNEITNFVSTSLNELIGFAADLGEEILKIFKTIGDAVKGAGEEVDKAINSVVTLFEDLDFGPMADFLKGFADVTAFAFDSVVAAVEIGTKILSGNFDEIDDLLWDSFSSSDFKRKEPTNIIGSLGCTKINKGEQF